MLLIFLAFLMKFIDVTKQQPPQGGDTNNNNNSGWQHVARNKTIADSNSSSTSSGCDSNNTSSSSKENVEQNHAITPQQLQQMRHYQRLQQQQLHLLQQQLLQRRRLQQQLLAEGVVLDRAAARKSSTTATLTCNQQYLLQQKQQQQQQQQYLQQDNGNLHWQQNHINNNHHHHNDNNNRTNHNLLNLHNKNDNNTRKNNNSYSSSKFNSINNNNNNNDVDYFVRCGFAKGQKSRRGMTDISTNNDISNNSHHSQPLQNSPHHQRHLHQQQHQHYNSPQHYTHQQQSALYHQQLANLNNHLTSINKQTHNHKINHQTLPLNSSSSANINHSSTTVATNSPTSATHSPLHYKNPLNSPNNSPFAYAYYGAHHPQQQQQHQPTTTASQQQQQQQLRLLHSKLSQTNYQQHLNDLFLQQQHLQQQQQQLLNVAAAASTAKDENGDDLSDECLKQNVAIVLNNLDRYNNALRSIILNEQVSNSLFDDSLLDFSSISSSNSNNNFLASSNNNNNSSSKMATAVTPESDYNSNATTPGSRVGSNMLPMQQQQQQQHDNVVGFATTASAACVNGGGVGMRNGWDAGGGGFCSNNIVGGGIVSNNLNCSIASSHDFTHDNSDYQWFLDYGYRDGCSMQRSVLSSLSASYNGIGELLYYEDLAKNIDANLAEVDMESFRAEDIHSLLSQLPSYCKNLVGGGGAGINCKLQQSLMQHQHLLPAHNMLSQTSISSANELIDNSICKSELLFSPVKESHLSVDSLDLDAYPDDGDIILTCKANKDNYTIAFEGSVLYSDDSFYEPNEISLKNKQNYINLHSNLDDIVKRKSLEVSMSRSEHQLTTWSKLKKNNVTQLQRYPSGNNNTSENVAQVLHAPHCTVRKSSSLPNLRTKKEPTCTREKLNVSHVSTSTIDSCRSRNLLPMCQMPISCSSITVSTSDRLTSDNSQQQQQQLQLQHNLQQRHHHHHHHNHYHHKAQQQKQSASSGETTTATTTSSATLQKPQQQLQNIGSGGNISSGHSGTSSNNQPAFNLVKLFIKQKSSCSSSEEHASAHTCMDVSSGCWPSSDAAGSSSSSSLEQRLRKKSMNDSGKGSALSRHDEEELRCDIVVESVADDSFHYEDGGDLDEYDVRKEMLIQAPNSTPRKQMRRLPNEVFYNEGSPMLRRRSLPLKHPQVCHLAHQNNNNNNNGSSIGSLQSSDASRSNSEQLMTQVYLSAGSGGTASNGTLERKKSRRREVNSASSEMITRSMQTSCGSLSTTRSSLSERFRFVPPSFLAKLNNLGEEKQAPIYVIYPNYALPDLGFVKTAANASDVIFSPFNYKTAIDGGSTNSINALKLKYTEDEILKNIDYKHVVDWKSLATLLPPDYRKRLQHIPEVGNLLLDREISQKPLFCMTPPIRRPNRTNICDCAQYFQQQQHQHQQQQTQAEGSSSSGSSQQPSSGYRGSSTLLTESEFDAAQTHTAQDPLKQMYVYQYDQQRMDSGVDVLGSPAVCNKPTPQPRGILRKTASQGYKRNSMIEGQSERKMTKLEKRRSLQEPPYQQYLAGGGSSDEFYAVLLEEEVFEDQLETYYAGLQQPSQPQPSQRLSRKDLDARARAENFLSSLPRSELKYYAEIASILESSEDQQHTVPVQYDAAALKKEVSRALSQQKKVSFNENDNQQQQHHPQLIHADATRQKRFSTPPNSPNISVAGGLRMPPSGQQAVPRRSLQTNLSRKSTTADSKEQLKISSNRFKRLQIQWELLSKDSSMMLKDLANENETKSGGSTPTSAQAAAVAAQRSRIPRPVSYPAGKRTPIVKPEVKNVANTLKPIVLPQIARISNQDATKTTRSPSRIVPPKRYSMTSPSAVIATPPGNVVTTPTGTITGRARTPTSRTATTAPNTPKRRVQSPRTIPRVR